MTKVISLLLWLLFFSKMEIFQLLHTCHKLWTEICEIRQIFKGDMIRFSEILQKSLWSSPKIVKSLYLNVRSL